MHLETPIFLRLMDSACRRGILPNTFVSRALGHAEAGVIPKQCGKVWKRRRAVWNLSAPIEVTHTREFHQRSNTTGATPRSSSVHPHDRSPSLHGAGGCEQADNARAISC